MLGKSSAACAILATIVLFGCHPPGVTTNYNNKIDVKAGEAKISKGMTEKEVIEILGEPTKTNSQKIAGREFYGISYVDESDEWLVLAITFEDGVVDWISVVDGKD